MILLLLPQGFLCRLLFPKESRHFPFVLPRGSKATLLAGDESYVLGHGNSSAAALPQNDSVF
jgi:hypothetical protein